MSEYMYNEHADTMSELCGLYFPDSHGGYDRDAAEADGTGSF